MEIKIVKELLQFFNKHIEPKFNPGDIVKSKNNKKCTYRIITCNTYTDTSDISLLSLLCSEIYKNVENNLLYKI